MSALAFLLISFGLIMIVTRGPLVLAPEKARRYYLELLSTKSTIRKFGAVFAIYGAVIVWVTQSDPSLVATIMYYLGLYIGIACLFLILFAGPFIGFYKTIVNKFSASALRIVGILSVTIGLYIINYALTM
jgi:uncharacterized protein YjeT (DUF2065 family)